MKFLVLAATLMGGTMGLAFAQGTGEGYRRRSRHGINGKLAVRQLPAWAKILAPVALYRA
jgi:hypothetical protein